MVIPCRIELDIVFSPTKNSKAAPRAQTIKTICCLADKFILSTHRQNDP